MRSIKDLGKNNQVRVELTDKGREVYGNCTKRESMCRIMPSLSWEQRQQLIACLETLRDATLEYLGEEQGIAIPRLRVTGGSVKQYKGLLGSRGPIGELRYVSIIGQSV